MTIGMDRNNPWDLLPEHVPWLGLSTVQPGEGPLAFDTLELGIRAGIKLCYTFQSRGWDTPTLFISRFAPPTENPTADYIANVCSWTGFRWDQMLDFHNPATLTRWAQAIFRQEQGTNGITDAEILAAKALADGESS